MELNESQLAEVISELIGVTGTVTVFDIDKEKATRYDNILSRNGYKTIVTPITPMRNSLTLTPLICERYQLTIRK